MGLNNKMMCRSGRNKYRKPRYWLDFTDQYCHLKRWQYWTDSGTDKIQRAEIDGSDVTGIVTRGLDTPSGIAIVGSKMYWTDVGTGKIERANRNGSWSDVNDSREEIFTDLSYSNGALRCQNNSWIQYIAVHDPG